MIPDYQQAMRPTLEHLADGQVHRTKDLKAAIASHFDLTDEELEQRLPSGKQTVISNRIGWALTHMTHAGLLTHPSHGRLQITDAGRQALEANDSIDVDVLFGYPEYAEWRSNAAPSDAESESDGDEESDPRQVWLVGAMIGNQDMTGEFVENGYWMIDGPNTVERDHLSQMTIGDRIAIKSSYTRKYDLPFESNGNTASVMDIKARGTITQPLTDGRIGVEWEVLDPPRQWYFYTSRRTIWKLPDAPYAEALEQFIFDGEDQDYDYFTADPYWNGRFGQLDQGEAIAPATEPPSDGRYTLDELIADGCFMPRAELQRIVDALRMNKNVILQGAPGTGKTWLARRLGWVLAGRKTNEAVRVVQFHPNTSYEDFVRGYRPSLDAEGGGTLQLVDGPFLKLAAQARDHASMNCTMVIEEINRGNPARALGEMLTLIESSKRNPQDGIHLTYSRDDEPEGIYLPENLHIIGTMNIADRSLALLDMALRRRFAFFTLKPQFDDAWREWTAKAIMDTTLIAQIADRVTRLNAQIAEDRTLGPDFVVGHSFFTPPIDQPLEDAHGWYRGQIETAVAPLLREYWYDAPTTAQQAIDELLA